MRTGKAGKVLMPGTQYHSHGDRRLEYGERKSAALPQASPGSFGHRQRLGRYG